MRLLAIRFSALGDVAMTVPVVLAALEQNPELEIIFVTRPFTVGLFPEHPRLWMVPADVDKDYKGLKGLLRLYRELAKLKIDAVADLHDVMRSQVVRTSFRFAGIPVSSMDKGRDEKKALVRRENKIRQPLRLMTERYADVLRQHGLTVVLSHQLPKREKLAHETAKIGIAPFAMHQPKAWPLSHVELLIELLIKEGKEVFILGGKSDQAEIEKLMAKHSISWLRASGLKEELKAIASLDAVVSMDSANMHLASLAGVPVVSIWGGTHPDAGFLGYGQQLKYAVQIDPNELPCRPCSVFGNVACHRGDLACMTFISAARVAEAVNQLLQENE